MSPPKGKLTMPCSTQPKEKQDVFESTNSRKPKLTYPRKIKLTYPRKIKTMNNSTKEKKKVYIEKFEGSFATEQEGCSIFINATVNLITCLDTAGLYLYLMCRPSGWQLNANQLAKHFHCDRKKIYKNLNSLKEFGLLTCELVRDENGQFAKPHYTVHLHPKTQIDKGNPPCTEKRHTAKKVSPCTEKPCTEKRHTYKTKNIKNKELKITTTTGERPYEIDTSAISSSTNIVISKEVDTQLLRLRKEHIKGDERTDEQFLRQCRWHLDNGDKVKYNFVRRLNGLQTIIKSGAFEKPASYKEFSTEEESIVSKYKHALLMSQYGCDLKDFVTQEEIEKASTLISRMKAHSEDLKYQALYR